MWSSGFFPWVTFFQKLSFYFRYGSVTFSLGQIIIIFITDTVIIFCFWAIDKCICLISVFVLGYFDWHYHFLQLHQCAVCPLEVLELLISSKLPLLFIYFFLQMDYWKGIYNCILPMVEIIVNLNGMAVCALIEFVWPFSLVTWRTG